MIILPHEAEIIRSIEREIAASLVKLGFQEVIFPRAIPYSNWEKVAKSLGPISKELESEVVVIEEFGSTPHVICHWQCEPYYLSLRSLGEDCPNRVFDRSGWSLRNEARIGRFRPRQFIRLEIVWRGHNEEVSAVHGELVEYLFGFLQQRDLNPRIIDRPEEMLNSNQRLVRDIVCTSRSGEEIEIVGTHLHGSTFMKRFLKSWTEGIESACLGISLSRIASLILDMEKNQGRKGEVKS